LNKQQIMYILRENESLRMKVQRLEQSAERLQTRYYDAENQLNNFKRKYDFLKSQFKEVARQCFPREYISNKIGQASEKEVYDFLIEKIKELENGVFETTEQNAKLMFELKETMEELQRFKNAGPLIQQTNVDVFEDGESEPVIGQNTISLERPEKIDKNAHPVYGIMSLLNDKEWEIIDAIAKENTLFSDIVTVTKINNSTTSELLNDLQEKGIINFEKIQKGGKGRPAHHYFLTSLGVEIYKLKFKEQPSTTMLEQLSTHGSPAHGGLMVEIGQFLEENGCHVDYDGPETTFKLKNGQEIRFDIKAYDKETKEVLVIEAERGKCGEAHLHDKFDKCLAFTKLLITKTIHIVAPNKESLHEIQQQLFRWVRKTNNIQMLQKNNKDKAAIIFKTATIDDFKKGKLQEFYYGYK